MICRYLDCGILRNGSTRLRCGECGYEYLLEVVIDLKNPNLKLPPIGVG